MSLWLLLIFISGILGSFIFAGFETGYLSWNPVKVRYRSDRTIHSRRIGKFLTNKNRVIATVLVGNNISIVATSLSFEKLFYILDKISTYDLKLIPSPDLIFLTPFLLIFTEMLPKSLFRIYSFKLTYTLLPVMNFFYRLFYPLTIIFTSSFSTKNAGKKGFVDGKRKELALIAAEGRREGTIPESVETLFSNMLTLKFKKVSEKEFSVDFRSLKSKYRITEEDTIEYAQKVICHLNRSFLPVFEKRKKKITGYIKSDSLFYSKEKEELVSIIAMPIERITYSTDLLSFVSSIDSEKKEFYLTGKYKIIVSDNIYRYLFAG